LIKALSLFTSPFFIISTLVIELAFNTNECPERHLEKLLIAYTILELFFISSYFIAWIYVLDNDQQSIPCCINCFLIGDTIWYIIGWCYLFYQPICKTTNPHMWN